MSYLFSKLFFVLLTLTTALSVLGQSQISNNSILIDQQVFTGSAPAQFSGSIPNGGSGTYTYQWERSTNNGSSWSLISGANGRDYSEGAITSATYFRRIVFSAPATPSTSNVVRVTLLLSAITSSTPLPCYGDSTASLTVTPFGGRAFCDPRTYISPASCTECTHIVSGNTSINVSSGRKVCILANTNYTGNISMNGGELIICGTATPSNLSINQGTIYVNGVLNLSSLSLTSNLSVHNYGTINASSSISGSGTMYNYHSIFLNSDYSISRGGLLVNNGSLVSSYGELNNNGVITNNGFVRIEEDLNNASDALITNNCTMLIGEDFENSNGAVFTNNGVFTVGEESELSRNSSIIQGPGGVFSSRSIECSGTISGPSIGCARVNISNQTEISSHGRITGRIDYCDANGIESNSGLMNNSIPACTCQDYSPNFDVSYRYAWSTGATTQSITGLRSGIYSVTVRDAHDNTFVVIDTIVDPLPLSVSHQFVNSSFPGAGDGSIALSVQGGTGSYNYNWAHGPVSQIVNGLNSGTYNVSISDANGCSLSYSVIIVDTYPLLTANLISAHQTILSGNVPVSFTGSMPSGGTGSYTYQWESSHSINGPFQTISGATSQNFSLNHNTGNLFLRRQVISSPVPASSSNVVSLVVLNYTLNAIANSPVVDGQTLHLSAIPSNSGGTFSWVGPNGFSGQGISLSIPNISMAASGVYSVTWSVDNVVLSAVRNVTVLPSITVQAIGTNERFPNALDGSVTAFVSGGASPFSYLWNTGDTSVTVTGLAAGSYSVIVTDANGFRDTASVTIVNNIPHIQLSVCYEGTVGSPATHARFGYTAWNLGLGDVQMNTVSNQGATPQNLNLGGNVFSTLWSTNAYSLNPFHYTWTLRIDSINRTATIAPQGILVTNQNACAIHFQPILNNVVSASQTILSGTVPQVFTGSLPSGGTHNQFTYQWEKSIDGGSSWVSIPSGTTKDFSEGVVVMTTYYRRIASSWSVAPVTSNVVAVTAIVIPVLPYNNGPVCAGDSVQFGSNSIVGATYFWTGPNGFTSNTPNPVLPSSTLTHTGIYSLFITLDGVTNTSTTTLIINQITASITKTDVLCFGFNTGSADLTVSGGSGNYSFQWSHHSQTEDQINVLVAGTYSVLTTDLISGCQATAIVQITQPSEIILVTSTQPATYPGSGDASISIQVSGGSPGYSFQWAHGPSIQNLTGLNSGTYSVIIRDANLCEKFDTVVVTNTYPLISANTIHSSQTILSGTAPLLFTGFTPIGGTGVYTYNWEFSTNGGLTWIHHPSGNQSNLQESLLNSLTLYRRIVNSVPVPAHTSNVITVTPVSYSITASNNGPIYESQTLNLSANPSNPGGTFSWAGPNGFTAAGQFPGFPNATLGAGGVYTVTQSIDNIAISATTAPVVLPLMSPNTITATQTILSGTSPAEFNGSIMTGGSGSYTYQWELSTDNGSTWQAISGGTNQNFSEGILTNYTEYRRIVNDGVMPATTSQVVSVTPVTYSITASNNGPVFVGSTLSLSALPSNPGGTYTWAGPNGYTGSGQYPSISNAQLSDVGVYTVYQHIDNVTISATTVPAVYPLLDNVISASHTLVVGNPRQTLTGNIPTGGTGVYAYQWEMSTNGGSTWSTLTGSTQVNLPGGPIGVNTDYRRIVTSGSLPPVASNVVNVTLVNYSITAANNGPVFEGSTLILTAFPSQPGGTYRWIGPNGFTGTGMYPAMPNAPLAAAGVYTVTQHIDNVSLTATTLAVVLPTLSPNTIIAAQTILSGSTPAAFTGSVITGGSGTYTYQWEYSTNGGSSWTVLPSGTTQNFLEAPITVFTEYRRIVNDALMGTTTSNVISVTPVSYSITASHNGPIYEGQTLNLSSTPSNPGGTYFWTGPNGFTANVQNPSIPNATLQTGGVYTVYQSVDNVTVSATTTSVLLPLISLNTIVASQTILSGTTPAAFTGSVMTGGTGNYVYQWERSTDHGSTWTTITGGTNSDFPEGPLSVVTDYRRIVSDGPMTPTTSNVVTVTPVSYSITASHNGPIYEGQTLNLSSTPSNPGGFYFWTGPNGFTSNVQNPSIPNATLLTGGVYTVYQSVDNVTVSATTTPVVLPQISLNTIIASQTILSGTTPAAFTGSVMTGGTGNFVYQWERSTDNGSTWTSIVDGTNSDFSEGPLSALTDYRRIVTDGPMTPISSQVITVTPLNYTLSAFYNTPVCAGTSIELSAISNAPGALFHWIGPNGYTATGANPVIQNAGTVHSGYYSVSVSIDNVVLSSQVLVLVLDPYNSIITGNNAPVCEGQSLILSAHVLPDVTYNWSGPNGFTAMGPNPVISNSVFEYSGTYTLTASHSICAPIQLPPMAVIVNKRNLNLQSNAPVCESLDVYMTAFPNNGAVYHWSGPNGFTASGDSIVRVAALPNYSGRYYLTGSVPGCGFISDSIDITVGRLVGNVNITSNTPVCANSTMLINAGAIVGLSYVWTGPNGFSSLSSNITRVGVTAQDSGIYTLTVVSPGCNNLITTYHAVVNSPFLTQASNNGPLCVGSTLNLSSICPLSTTFSWTGPNGFSANGDNVVLSNITLNQAGIYSVSVVIPGCGQAIATTSVIINEPASILTPVTNGPLCVGMNLELSVQGYANANYLWTGPNGLLSTNRITNVSRISMSAAGVYSVQVTIPACGTYFATTDTLVVRDISAISSFTPTPAVCESDVIYLYSNMSRSLGQSTWFGPDGWTSNMPQVGRNQAQRSMAGVYTFVAVVNGCGTIYDLITIGFSNRIPFNLDFGSNAPICQGATLILTAQDIPNASYLWTGPNGYSSSSRVVSVGNIQTQASGQYNLTVSTSICPSVSLSTNVVVNNLSLPNLSSNDPVCSGGLLNIRTGFLPQASYLWTGPNGFTSNFNEFYITQANPSHSGVYSLNAMVPGCGGITRSISVTVNDPFPVNPLMQTNSPICEGNDLVMEVAHHSNASYLWSGPNGFTSNNRNPRIDFAQSSASGVYSVDVSIPGCPSRGLQLTNIVNPLPVITTSVTSPICEGQVLFLNATVSPPLTQVSWAGPNGFTSNVLGSAISNAQTLNTGLYTFFANVPGCGIVEHVQNVIVNSPVNTTSITGSTTVCVSNALALSPTNIGNASYFWAGPLGFTSGTRDLLIPNIQLNQAGQYSLTVVQPGCNTFSATRTVSVNNVIPPVATVDRTAYCSGQPIYFSSTAVSGALAYNWTGPAGYSVNNRWPSRSNSNITHAGEYTLSVPTSQCGTLSTSVLVVVGPLINSTSASSNSPACAGGTLNLMSNIPDAIGVSHTWIAPNATTYHTRNVDINSIDISAAGTYTYIVVSPGCGTATRTRRVSVSDPTLVTATSNGPVCQGQVVYFTGTGPAGTTYSWQGPGGYMASTQFPARSNARLAHAGIYTLNANVPGCGIVSTTTALVVNVCRFADDGISDENLPEENQKLLATFNVYPNPFSSTLNIAWGDVKVFSIIVYDAHGKVLHSFEPGDVKGVKFDTVDLPSGLYLIKALTSAGPIIYRTTKL